MGVGIEALFTSALGLQEPWSVEKVELDTARRRIDFELTCKATGLPCPHCQAAGQGVHDRLERQWRHLDFFQYEAWLHAKVPRIACKVCGKTTQMDVPWAREASGHRQRKQSSSGPFPLAAMQQINTEAKPENATPRQDSMLNTKREKPTRESCRLKGVGIPLNRKWPPLGE